MEPHLEAVRAAVSVSEQAFRKVKCYAANLAPTAIGEHRQCRHDIEQLARLLRDISACLYQVQLTLSCTQDDDADAPQDIYGSFNLHHINHYRELIRNLERDWPPLSISQTKNLNEELRRILAQLSLALAADTTYALLRALSQPDRLPIPARLTAEVHLPVRLLSNPKPNLPTVRDILDPARVAQWSDTRLNTFLRLRTPGSLDLTMQSPLIQGWLEGKVPRLWLCGPQGSGKTVLASTILERLIAQTRDDPTTAVCYYMFDSMKPWSMGSRALLASLLGQLAAQNQQANTFLRIALNPHLVKDKSKLPTWITQTILEDNPRLREGDSYRGQVFLAMQRYWQTVYLVLDGPDEGGKTGMEALTMLHKCVQKIPAKGPLALRMMVVCREPSDEEGALRLRSTGYQTLDVTPEPRQIQLHVEHRLQDYARADPACNLDAAETARIVEAITSKTRSFEVAEYQIDYLLSLSSEAERDVAMRSLPTYVWTLHAAVVGRPSDPYEQEIIRTTLRWTEGLGSDELRLDQLSEAISVFLSRDAKTLAELRPVTESQILRLCGPLARRSLDGSNIELTYRNELRINLAYRNEQDSPPEIAVNVGREVGVTCLRFLNMEEFSHEPQEYRRYLASRRDAHPFYRYAAWTWMEMLSSAGRDQYLEKEFMDEACRLFDYRNSGNFSSWFLEMAQHKFLTVFSTSPAQTFVNVTALRRKTSLSPLHIAACLGIGYLCAALVRRGLDVNLESEIGTPLYCALTGPVLLLSSTMSVTWSNARQEAGLDPRLDTAESLMKLGAQPREMRASKTPSFASAALMACAARMDSADLTRFSSLCPKEQYIFDKGFLAAFEDAKFPFESTGFKGSITSLTPQRRFLDSLCILLIDGTWMKSLPKIWFAAWDKAVLHELPCISPAMRRELPIDDDAFAICVSEAMQVGLEPPLRRLMQDNRWDGNRSLTGMAEEDSGRTLLHQAVEDSNTKMVELLLRHGRADVSVADARGRTPLHLCERSDVLTLLVSHGADLGRVDNDGRTIWHYAAANNDIELLRTLAEVDRDQEAALRRTTNQGRTPMAEAFAFVRELTGRPPLPQERLVLGLVGESQSVLFFTELCTADNAYIRSDVPVLCYAAEWGIPAMVAVLRDQFPSLDLVAPDGSTPLHYLNFLASPRLISMLREVPGVSQLPVLNHHGQTPAETIFLAFKPNTEEYEDNAHPSNLSALDRSAYEALLTEDVRKSRDKLGRTLWERFCTDAILHYASRENWPHVPEAISMAVSCFVETGVVVEYEEATGSCAFLELFRAVCFRARDMEIDPVPRWLPAIYVQLLQATTKIEELKNDSRMLLALRSTMSNNESLYLDLEFELTQLGVNTTSSPL